MSRHRHRAHRVPSSSRRAPLRTLGALIGLCAAALLVSCVARPVDEVRGGTVIERHKHYAQSLDKDVDILFIVDSSFSMDDEQKALAANFPKLIEALRVPELDNKLPNVHIGVITPDLGVPNGQGIDKCGGNGDGARLIKPSTCGVSLPTERYITYNPDTNATNIPGNNDPIQRVKDAFSCMAKVGINGCGFEQQLEAARRALDPKLNLNPGFLRDGALLVLVFITDEDDCSASNPQMYTSPNDPLGKFGPLHSFRCFDLGFTCDINDRTKSGPRQNCVPRTDFLHDVRKRYVDFFKQLKPEGRTIVANIATPTDRVEVVWGSQDKTARLASPCPGNDDAAPALRLKAFSDAFAKEGSFDNICQGDFSAPLTRLGARIIADLGGQCVPGTLLDRNGSVVCRKGDAIGPPQAGAVCQGDCLHNASCNVTEVHTDGARTPLPRCGPAQFNDPSNTSCGETCPCWRIVPRSECTKSGSPPYGFEILRRQEAPKGTTATFRCRGALPEWTSPDVLDVPRCE